MYLTLDVGQTGALFGRLIKSETSTRMLRGVIPYVAAGAGVLFVGYCIYFDKKRRSHPDFMKNLRKKRMEQKAREAQKASSFPMPPINDQSAMQRFFLEQIQQGETALSMGSVDEGVKHFAVAVSVCGQPNQLLQVLQQSLSPTVFLRLIEILPSVQSFVLPGFVVFLVISRSQADVDPYDMFGASSADQEMGEFHSWNDSSSLVSGDKSNVAINHHRELHRILVRTLWRNIYPGNKPDALSKTPVKVHLEFVLQEQDIHTLSKYCDSNNDSANLISPDLINDIFSGIIRPVTLSDEPKLFHWLNDKPLFWISMLASFTLAIWLSILIYHSRHRLLMLVLSLLLVLIISQSMYKKYNTRLAQKMSVLSRYNGPPVDCKPPDQQPWSRFFTQYFTSRPKTDECLQYYEEVLSEPFFTTSIYEVCLELIYQPIISLCGSLGTAFGEFYNNVSAYIPWWLSPIILGYFIFLAFLFVVRAPKSLSNEQPLRSRRAKHKIKSSTVPPLTSS